MKCCGDAKCVSESCHSYDSCDGKSCTSAKIELIDGFYPIKIPVFVFESDLEFAIQQGARLCHDIWQRHNWKKDK